MFAKPVIPSGNAASAQIFSGSERATPQAFSASGRRCLLEPLPQEDWVPNPGRSRHSWYHGQCAAGNPRVEGSPGCNTRQGPTADFPLGEVGGRGLDTLGSGVSPPRTPASSSPVPGWVAPPEERGERLS